KTTGTLLKTTRTYSAGRKRDVTPPGRRRLPDQTKSKSIPYSLFPDKIEVDTLYNTSSTTLSRPTGSKSILFNTPLVTNKIEADTLYSMEYPFQTAGTRDERAIYEAERPTNRS
ncbi:hypothetical protein BC936DRAFT_144175, partial [Jimgerdemannia flammicorona]